MKRIIIVHLLLLNTFLGFGQSNDSTHNHHEEMTRWAWIELGEYADSSKRIEWFEEKSIRFWWGNKWNFGLNYGLSNSHEVGLSIGRSFDHIFMAGLSHQSIASKSIGLSLIRFQNDLTFFPSLIHEFQLPFPLLMGTKLEVLLDTKVIKPYLRIGYGISILKYEILYQYGFGIPFHENKLGHGFSLKYRFFSHKRMVVSVADGC